MSREVTSKEVKLKKGSYESMSKPSSRFHGSSTLLRGLNRAQTEAVTTTEGPLLVLAGAGTGKTRVITHRVAHLLELGASPDSILGVTFTNKAAREMRDRVTSLLGRRPKGLTLSTFHALGVRILREDAESLGLRSNFTIYDQSDQVSLIRSILRDIRGAVSSSDAQGVHARISLAKNRGLDPDDLVDDAEDDYEYLIGRAYHRYKEELQSLNCVDFDDLIRLPVELLENHDDVREGYLRRFRYFMIDEYQDTNGAQYRFARALVGPERNLCVVGDDDQSIYGFRGAELDKILRFEKDFPGTTVVKLEENYRSTDSILSLANAVIELSPTRHQKTLRSRLGRGLPVEWIETADGPGEVDCVLERIRNLRRQSGRRYEDFAVLLRSVIQARPFEEKLRLREIPYKLVGGQSYFDRKEIRDVLAYWSVASNPQDDLSLLRIINTPKRGIGSTTLQKLDAFARTRGKSLYDALGAVAEGAGEFPTKPRAVCRFLVKLFEQARTRAERGEYATMCRELLDTIEYRKAVEDLYPDPMMASARWNAVDDMLDTVERWETANRGSPFSEFQVDRSIP